MSSMTLADLQKIAQERKIILPKTCSIEEILQILYSQQKDTRKFSPPTSSISSVESFKAITILPQSATHVLIVWNVTDCSELDFKAWQIKNEYGLDILLPYNARSLLLPIKLLPKFRFQIFRVLHDNGKVLFGEYEPSEGTSHTLFKTLPSQTPTDEYLDTQTSGNNFLRKNNKASEHMLRR